MDLEKDPEELLEDYDKEHEGDDEDKNTKGDKDAGDDDTSKDDDTDDTGKKEDKEEKKDVSDTGKEDDELQKLTQELKDNPLSDIPDDWIPKNYKELLEKSKEVFETETHNAKIKEQIDTKEKEKIASEARNLMDNEIADLTKDGKLPEVKDAMDENDPGVKRQVEVYEYMTKMNQMYLTKGLSQRLTSFNLGLTMLEAEEAAKRVKEDEDKETQLNKRRGSLVGGGTPSSKGKDSGYNPPVAGESLSDAAEDVINSL